MWQLVFGAAVAGSARFLAKRLFNPNTNDPISQDCSSSVFEQERLDICLQNEIFESGFESNREEKQKQGEIFRFSSSVSSGKTGVKANDKNLREKIVLKKAEKRPSGGGGGGGGVEVNRKKIAVCLKKRKSAKNVAYECGSLPSKDSSEFRRGLGFGIMYTMSAGRAELDKLNSAVDETAKVVQEIKTMICKRKSYCNVQASNSANEVAAGSKRFSSKNSRLLLEKSGTGNVDRNEIGICSLPGIEDGEYASSVLTEEPEPESEVVEMDHLEAELELELRKLSETDVSAKASHEPAGETFDSYQCQGVLPSELDQKLCHLLIEQQGIRIEELETELSSARSKLREKETELQALKDCVRRLSNFSLSTVSDDDSEVRGDRDCPIESRSETRKSLVGMKRHYGALSPTEMHVFRGQDPTRLFQMQSPGTIRNNNTISVGLHTILKKKIKLV